MPLFKMLIVGARPDLYESWLRSLTSPPDLSGGNVTISTEDAYMFELAYFKERNWSASRDKSTI